VVFVAAMFMSIMDATIVNVALPTIGRDFKVSPTAVDTISIAFLVSLAVFIRRPAGSATGWAASGAARGHRGVHRGLGAVRAGLQPR
jgi:MFS family permease